MLEKVHDGELRAIFRALPDLYFRLDADGTINEYRAGRPADLYVAPEQFLGRPMQDVLPPEVGGQIPGAIAKALASDEVVTLEYWLPMPGGSQAYEARLVSLPSREVIVIVRNVTELKRAEEAQRQLYREAQSAVRARDEFISAIAHELKTPLTSLRGFAQWALHRLNRGEPTDPARLHRAFDVIDRQTERLSLLVLRMLDVSQIDAGLLELHPQMADVAALARAIVARAQADAPGRVLVLRAPSSTPARLDADRIGQALRSLVDNALRFSPSDTDVEIEVSTPDPQTVRLTVRDYGPGIPPEMRPQLFRRYFQGPDAREVGGLGLSLYISRKVIELHGGHMEAEFPADGGTRFIITLPNGL